VIDDAPFSATRSGHSFSWNPAGALQWWVVHDDFLPSRLNRSGGGTLHCSLHPLTNYLDLPVLLSPIEHRNTKFNVVPPRTSSMSLLSTPSAGIPAAIQQRCQSITHLTSLLIHNIDLKVTPQSQSSCLNFGNGSVGNIRIIAKINSTRTPHFDTL
jgi:hypothetical protein